MNNEHFWRKKSRSGKDDFENYYFKYKNNDISLTEFAYSQNISVAGLIKRIKYYEENKSTHYKIITKQHKEKALILMGKYIYLIKNFDIKNQEKLTDVLYRTCLYIVKNKDEIRNEKAIILFSLKRKCKDLKYEEFKNKEICCFDNNRIKDKINYEIYCKVGDDK